MTEPTDTGLVATRQLVVDRPLAWFALAPGDVALVRPGETIEPGTPLAERARSARTHVIRAAAREAASLRPGDRWPPAQANPGRRGDHAGEPPGEVLFSVGGRWRIAVADRSATAESPVHGQVTDVEIGVGIRVRLTGRAIIGRALIGEPVHGPLEVAVAPHAELRASAIDVGRSGAIVVAGSHIDAEAITRARATGVHGIVVASLGASVRRDLAASAHRRRASLHANAPFGILVLDGAVRRPMAGPMAAIFDALAGYDVGLLSDPPALVIDDPTAPLPVANPSLVRVTGGPFTGREGVWAGAAPSLPWGTGELAAGLVDLGDDGRVAVPLGDLERLA